MKTRTEGQQGYRDDIRDNVAEWLERQPSFSYDLEDIQLSQEEPPRWARICGTEDLATDENVAAGDVPHVISFTVAWPLGELEVMLQRRIGTRQAKAIERGQRILEAYGVPIQEHGAAQDAVTDVLEAVDFYGGDAKDVLVAALAHWDYDRPTG